MSLCENLPSTPRLKELIATVVLGGKTEVPVKEEGITFCRYAWPKEGSMLVKEVFNRIHEVKRAVATTRVQRPNKEPAILLHTSGWLSTMPNEIGILIPLHPAEVQEAKLLMERRKENRRQETELVGGIIVVFEDVSFQMPVHIPFLLLLCPISPLEPAE